MSGFINSTSSFGLGGRTPTNDYTRPGFQSSTPTSAVEILPNMNKGTVQKASERLPQFVNEPVQSVDVLISSQNRISGTKFDFTADIGSTIFRPRLVSVDAVVLPKLFNITPKNNTVRVQFGVYSTSLKRPLVTSGYTPSPVLEFNLPTGYYTPTHFINTFSSSFRDAFQDQVVNGNLFSNWNYLPGQYVIIAHPPYTAPTNLPPPTTAVTFDTNTNTFGIGFPDAAVGFNFSNSPGPGPFAGSGFVYLCMWMDETCSFITRGKNFIPFGTVPLFPPNENTGYTIPSYYSSLDLEIPSGTAGLRYTRWCTLSSNALNRFAYGESRVSRVGDGGGRGKIIAVLDTSYYDYVEDGYGGSFIPIQYPNAAVININNAQGQLEQYLDFVVRDEYGDTLDGLSDNPLDQIGITFWLKVTF